MKHRKHFHAGYSLAVWATFVGLSVALPAIADTEVPCLVLSGHAHSEHSIDLSKLNRITFGSESMTISRAGGDAKETQELLYSLYHHIEIKNAMPDIETGADITAADGSFKLLYLPDTRSLLIDSGDYGVFTVGIFHLDGGMIMTAEMTPGNPLPLERLPEGIYVAVATDKRINLNIKFRLK